MRAERRGLLLAFGSAVGVAVGAVPFKLATEDADPAHVVVAMLLAAATFNTIAAGREYRTGAALRTADFSWRDTIWLGVVLGVLAAVANFCASQAIALLDVSVTTLLIQLQVFFAAVLGWLWLRERVSGRFVLGASLAVGGLAVMSGAGDVDSAAGLPWGLAAAAAFGTMQVATRRVIARVSPVQVNALRLWLAVALVAVVPGSLAGAGGLSFGVVVLAALAALCGPVLGRLAMMNSARFIPAARSTLVGLASPVLAVPGDIIFFDGLPSGRVLFGGAVVLVGMAVALAPAPDRGATVASTVD